MLELAFRVVTSRGPGGPNPKVEPQYFGFLIIPPDKTAMPNRNEEDDTGTALIVSGMLQIDFVIMCQTNVD